MIFIWIGNDGKSTTIFDLFRSSIECVKTRFRNKINENRFFNKLFILYVKKEIVAKFMTKLMMDNFWFKTTRSLNLIVDWV